MKTLLIILAFIALSSMVFAGRSEDVLQLIPTEINHSVTPESTSTPKVETPKARTPQPIKTTTDESTNKPKMANTKPKQHTSNKSAKHIKISHKKLKNKSVQLTQNKIPSKPSH